VLNLHEEAQRLLVESDQAAMSNTAYDTAWVARAPGANGSSPAFPEALNWLRQNQYSDGSWGARSRVITTTPDSCVANPRMKRWVLN
jgi:hypothetical protein